MQNFNYCDECGQFTVFEGDLHTIDSNNKEICQECLERLYVLCEGCAIYFRNDDELYSLHEDHVNGSGMICEDCISNGEYCYCGECEMIFPCDSTTFIEHADIDVCDLCFENDYTTCRFCDNYYHFSNIVNRSDDSDAHCCNDCINDTAFQCEDCGEIDHSENAFYTGDNSVCESCFHENYGYCAYCDEVYNQRDLCFEGDQPYCEDCAHDNDLFYSSNSQGSGPIFNYMYKPKSKFFGNNSKHSYGIELEVENVRRDKSNNDMARDIMTNGGGMFYCKEDSSIGNGFEIVSHPFSWQWYKENKQLFDQMLENLDDNGFESYGPATCGIHVHISKSAFEGNVHLYKFLKLFYENHDFIYKISQRSTKSTSGACQWGNHIEGFNMSQNINKATTKNNLSSGHEARYTAVNLANPDTIEVRIFRGTLNKVSFFKNIEFIEAAYNFTQSSGFSKITVDNFTKFVVEHHKTYSNLYTFMAKKGFKGVKKMVIKKGKGDK